MFDQIKTTNKAFLEHVFSFIDVIICFFVRSITHNQKRCQIDSNQNKKRPRNSQRLELKNQFFLILVATVKEEKPLW